ncbi:hypothetical protein J2756_000530 [Methanobacterium aggregans]|nr:hypothetical protein [Methanobacterium aggregans]
MLKDVPCFYMDFLSGVADFLGTFKNSSLDMKSGSEINHPVLNPVF